MARKAAQAAAATMEDPTTLVAWERNPRINDHAVNDVAGSIQRFGFGAPIVARLQDRRVIAGHTRLKAALQLGLSEIPVRFMELTEQEADAMALADNRLGEIADWEDDDLARVLYDLAEQDVTIDDLGWTADELSAMLDGLIHVEEHTRKSSGEGDPDKLRPTPGAADLRVGDCLHVLREVPDASIDALVTDPPYGLSEAPDIREVLTRWLAGEEYDHDAPGFMGEHWDSFVPGPAVWSEAFRVMKPGAYGVVFAGTRTADLMGIALRLAGFEVRDLVEWCYWVGFPKSLDLAKAIDKKLGHEPEVIGTRPAPGGKWTAAGRSASGMGGYDIPVTRAVTPEAQAAEGYGTALKPAHEPIWLIRKPLQGTVADNWLANGVGALNIDACRFLPGDPMWPAPGSDAMWERTSDGGTVSLGAVPWRSGTAPPNAGGRFPANLVHACKPSQAEKQAGCEGLPARETKQAAGPGGWDEKPMRNWHKTVKPLRLMAWLCRLVCPPGGKVLDPFIGSGTTGAAAVPQGFGILGIELREGALRIAEQRIAYWTEVGLDEVIARDMGEDEEMEDSLGDA